MLEFLNEYKEINSKLFRFIRSLQLFLAPLELPKRLRERIEAAISISLNNQPGVVGKFQDEGVRYRPIRSGEKPIKTKITFPAEIRGLEKELEI